MSAATTLTYDTFKMHEGASVREWIMKELAVLTAEQAPTGDGLIVVKN